jgi:hypothetical protein
MNKKELERAALTLEPIVAEGIPTPDLRRAKAEVAREQLLLT